MPSQTKTIASNVTSTVLDDFGAAWQDLQYGETVDGLFASSTDSGMGDDSTDDVVLADWGFDIPANATIVGVSVGFTHLASSQAASFLARLHELGTTDLGDPKQVFSKPTSGPDTDTLGGASDLWGATLTPVIVNDPAFGVRYRVLVGSSSDSAFLDGMAVTVYYILPGGLRTRLGSSRRGLGPR